MIALNPPPLPPGAFPALVVRLMGRPTAGALWESCFWAGFGAGFGAALALVVAAIVAGLVAAVALHLLSRRRSS